MPWRLSAGWWLGSIRRQAAALTNANLTSPTPDGVIRPQRVNLLLSESCIYKFDIDTIGSRKYEANIGSGNGLVSLGAVLTKMKQYNVSGNMLQYY